METLLNIRDLHCSFHLRHTTVRAVRGVSLALRPGEFLGIVGESGSGKSVLCSSLTGLIEQPPGRVDGEVVFDGTNLLTCDASTMRSIRGDRITMVFQDPSTSLNPYLRIGDQVAEPLVVHRGMGRAEALDRAREALAEMGIDRPSQRLRNYPYELSGGMRQRAMIAMALVTQPALVIADEPTTALDVTVQSQILRVLGALRSRQGMALMFVTHNLALVNGFCDTVAVMYAGRIVERAPTADLITSPLHPYTRALLSSVPSRKARGRLVTIPGAPPDPSGQYHGCPFAPRCPFAVDMCRDAEPPLADMGGRQSACVRVFSGEHLW